jgi:glycosyltransferase involved in cell wall biosynthesis
LIKKVSIIITAFNRADYIIDALQSVNEQQTLEYEKEIIVVKNFNDPKTDDIIKKMNAIVVEGGNTPLCDYTYKGIINSTGQYIFFIDDDDLFIKDKIINVINIMSKYEIDFYHNAYIPANDELKPIKSVLYKQLDKPLMIDTHVLTFRDLLRILKFKGDINLSSMCINRRIIDEKFDLLTELSAGPDWFLLFASIANGKRLYFDNQPLTIYRVHNSTANLNSTNIREFLAKRRHLIRKEIYSLKLMERVFKSNLIKRLIRLRIATDLIQLSILGEDKSDRIRNSGFSLKMMTEVRTDLFGILLILIYLARHIFPSASKRAYYALLRNATFGKD